MSGREASDLVRSVAAGGETTGRGVAVAGPLGRRLAARIRAEGPMPAVSFLEAALYDPEHGYYAGAARRSGCAGDFFTSADVGPLFGELLAVQIGEMLALVAEGDEAGAANLDLVEAGAGDGRLARDILDALAREQPALYARLRLHLVERSATARAAQPTVLAGHLPRLVSSGEALPDGITGVLVANELLDAMPPHLVVMREDGLREIFVGVEGDRFVEVERGPSTPALEHYFARAGVRLEPGWRAEVNLRAIDWVRRAARALERGFLLLVDYGHEAAVLYSPSHAAGTLAVYARHTVSIDPLAWLEAPGTRDLTAHVDLTSVRLAAEEEGLETIGLVDQMYFVLALGLAERLDGSASIGAVRRRLAARALVQPGGLGSTHKVLVFARRMGRPALRGLAGGGRLT